MRSQGFSLVEVLITITVMGIIMAIAVPNYTAMNTKAKIEKQTRELYATIVTTRMTAMQNKKPGALYLGPKQVVYKVYTSYNDTLTTAWKTVSTTNLPFTVSKLGSTTALDVTSDKIEFDVRGFTNNDMTLLMNPVTYGGGANCIKVHTARTNIGRMVDASTCTIQ